jgi:hypothetical protein
MSAPPAAALLDDLAKLTHRERMRRLVDVGRRVAAGEPEAAAVTAELAARPNAYARLLALQTVFGSRDGARVLAALSDPSALVRRRARRMVPVFCDDAQAAAAIEKVPPGRPRAGLCRRLSQRRREAVVDAFLASALGRAAQPDSRLAELVPFGSAAAQERHAQAMAAGGPVLWTRTAAWQPERAVAQLVAMGAGDGAVDMRARWTFRHMLPVLARRHPDAALRVARHYLEKAGGAALAEIGGVVQLLAQRRPAEVFDLLREVHERSRPELLPGVFRFVRFGARAERLGLTRLSYLVRLGGSPLPDRARGLTWLRRLPEADRDRLVRVWLAEGCGSWGAFLLRHVPEAGDLAALRERAFERWQLASKRDNGSVAVEHLAWLPRDLRAREARRHLQDVPDLVTRPRERMAYACLLPFAEAKEALAPWLGHPEGEERAAALRVWIGAVRFERASLPDALAAVKARKFEQDPVRLAMLDALGALPLGAFRAEHLDDVGKIVQDALDAADLSHATAAAAERLVVRLFRKDAAWGARWLAKLLAARGSVSALGLGDGLTAAEAKALAPAIAELAQAWLTRERASALLWLAASLGRRLPLVEDLVLALELCAQDLPFVGVAASALDLLARHARPRFAALVPKLLAQDRSFAILPRVARFVSRSRQDLLDPLLDPAPVTGRFATGRSSWVLDFGDGHAAWTDRQHAAHARSLLAILHDQARDVPAVLSSLETLFQLAFADPAPMVALASDPRPPVRERAVRYLARIDGGEGVPVLVECLGDDRARFAIYSLRRAFAEMAPAEVLAVLRAAPMGKVTVAKEVLRLAGEIAGEDGFRTLLSFDRPDLHRDVRIALLRALWDHLDRDETWSIFERASQDKDWVVVSRLADIPVGRLTSAAEARLAQLLARVLERPEVEARIELLRRIAHHPLRDAGRALFAACLLRMAGPHPEESRIATEAALQRMLPAEAEAVIRRMAQLCPQRRLLLGFLEALRNRLTPQAAAPLLRIGHGLLATLRADPRVVPQAIALAPRLLGWEELADMLVDLVARDLLHADAMVEALQAARSTTHPELFEARLAGRPDPRLRRIAVAALAHAARPGHGWSEERRARLDRYRADPSPLVAGAAEMIFPA